MNDNAVVVVRVNAFVQSGSSCCSAGRILHSVYDKFLVQFGWDWAEVWFVVRARTLYNDLFPVRTEGIIWRSQEPVLRGANGVVETIDAR